MAASMCGRGRNFSHSLKRVLSHFRQNSVLAQESYEEDSLYPPVKPKFPEGKWGSMERGRAWSFHNRQTELAEMKSVEERINHFSKKKMNMWCLRIVEHFPRTLPYHQYVTKTHLVDGLPKLYESIENVDDMVNRVKEIVLDQICLEKEIVARTRTYKDVQLWEKENLHTQILFKSILNTLVMCLDCSHLLTAQQDENVRVKAFWDRHGISRYKTRFYKDSWNKEQEKVYESRIQANFLANLLLRTEDPLPEFVPRDDDVCVSAPYPSLDYIPTTYGQVRMKDCTPKVVPGHWYGDPCEFGFLNFNSCNDLDYLGKKYGRDNQEDFLTSRGMNISFVKLVAEAYYQGFNTFQDVTYPFTTQTILSDGKFFSFFTYQLNTLNLWKDDDANPLRNICWQLKNVKLYDTVEDGQVKGFNEECLKLLVRFLLVRPGRPGVELRPTLPPKPPIPQVFLEEKKEQVVIARVEKYM